MNKKGFTLIELLVVVSIIGLLASIILAALNNARAKARDAQLISSAKELQKALALYADDNDSTYPPHTADGSTLYYTSIKGDNTDTILKSALSQYMPQLPTVGMFQNSDKNSQEMSRLSYRRITNPTAFGLTTAECDGGKCYALLIYTETKTALGPSETAIYLLHNGDKIVGYDARRY